MNDVCPSGRHDIDVNAIAEAVVNKIKARSIPFEYVLWSCQDIADYLGREMPTVRDRYAALPDFPKVIRIEGKGRKLYKAIDVVNWAMKQ